MGERLIPAKELHHFVQEVFQLAGVSDKEASCIAENLVEANLYGHDSHGSGLVPTYIGNLKNGTAVAGQEVRIVTDCGSMVGLDGQLGFGQSIGIEAMEIGIERAKKYGVAIVGLANTHHLARIGHWGEQCAKAGLGSIHFVNVLHDPAVAPWGGSDARIVTNPFCATVPYSPEPLVLDFATSATAYGKVRVAFEAGKEVPPGQLIDAEGKPTTDPSVLMCEPFGAILPFGGHKGAGLAFMCEVLGGALSGGAVQDRKPVGSPITNNMISIIFEPYRLQSKEEFEKQIGSLMDWMKASPPVKEGEEVKFPGQVERETYQKRSAEGIPIAEGTLRGFVECARELGMKKPEKILGL